MKSVPGVGHPRLPAGPAQGEATKLRVSFANAPALVADILMTVADRVLHGDYLWGLQEPRRYGPAEGAILDGDWACSNCDFGVPHDQGDVLGPPGGRPYLSFN